jgi:pimeloyl-ACP methyl ester carboxylesterase
VNKFVFPAPSYEESQHHSLINKYDIKFITKENKSVPYILHRNKSDKYIVFAHGNGTDITIMSSWVKNLANLLNVNAMLFEYPGYSVCNGPSCEQGCCENIEIAVDYLIETLNIPEENIYLIGQSLGTGIIVDFIAKRKWQSPTALISPYKSIVSVVMNDESCSSKVVKSTVDMFETMKKIDKVIAPIKIFHGEDDNTINISHGKELYRALNNKLIPVWFPNTGHCDIIRKITLSQWQSFINS